MLFTDSDLDAIHIESTWKKNRDVQDGSCQTHDVHVQESGVQTTQASSVEVQTDETIEEEILLWNDDSPELLNFLRRIEPLVSEELNAAQRSHAFDGYEVKWEEDTETVTCLHTLTQSSTEAQLHVTGLSWNATGAVIAASYGRFDHDDWCTHRSALCTWNVDRPRMAADRPGVVIELSSCLLCLAFHPTHPAWIAAGSFNGEVLVWDAGREEDAPIATSGIGDNAHHEPVHNVNWVRDPTTKGSPKYNLVSVAGDGRILVWKFDPLKRDLQLKDGFMLLTESMPRELRPSGRSGRMGVTSLGFLPTDETAFVIGAESGGVFRCSTGNVGAPTHGDVSLLAALRSPVTLTFAPHRGPVYSVHASPHHRNLFLTCSTDKSARIYSMLQTEPVLTLEPGRGYLYAVGWSPSSPLVFAVGTEDGQLLLYDLGKSRGTPVLTLGGATDKRPPIYSLRFNEKRPRLLASGDADGKVHIWRLNDELTRCVAHDTDVLQQLATTGATTQVDATAGATTQVDAPHD